MNTKAIDIDSMIFASAVITKFTRNASFSGRSRNTSVRVRRCCVMNQPAISPQSVSAERTHWDSTLGEDRLKKQTHYPRWRVGNAGPPAVVKTKPSAMGESTHAIWQNEPTACAWMRNGPRCGTVDSVNVFRFCVDESATRKMRKSTVRRIFRWVN
jgi:hypothetical protein